MLKLIGSLLVVGSMTGFGIWKAEEMKKSYQALINIQNLIGQMQCELKYARLDFGEMFGELARYASPHFRNWLLGMKIQMEQKSGSTFPEIWNKNVDGFLRDSGLNKVELARLKSLGKSLGGMDLALQIRTMERYQEQMELEIREMRRDMQMRMRLRVCLGVSGGILIMLILI